MLRDGGCPLVIFPLLCLPQGEEEVVMGEGTQEDESSILTIQDVTRAHAGLYQCTASNGIALPASVNVQLIVQCKFLMLYFQCQKEIKTQKYIYDLFMFI